MRQRAAQTSPRPGGPQKNGRDGGTKFNKQKKKGDFPAFAPVFFVLLIFAAIIVLILQSSGGLNGLRRRFPQPEVILTAKLDRFTPTPEVFKRTFWVEQKKINEPITRAFRDRGWTKVNNYEEAQLAWTYSNDPDFWVDLKPWQRTNHIPGFHHWNAKDAFVEGFKNYERRVPGKDHYFNPETYRLEIEDEREEFQKMLTRGGGLNRPWVLKAGNVNQGKGITMLAPNSKALKNVLDDHPPSDSDLVIQRYVCNELTWNRRKYDVRMFWIVASIDPLLVLYHDGYVRVGNAVYDESDFSNTRNHLTTHTRLAEEGKGTWDEFEQHVRQHNRAANLGISDPVAHVRNQFKEAIGETVAAFKDTSFTTKKMVEQNGIAFYGADFILDQDLDVFFLEPQMGCGLDEDYNFRIQMHDQMFRTMVDVLDEVLVKQEQGENLLPLKNPGFWQVVYADGWVYKYDGYERSKQKRDCELPRSATHKHEDT
eukprot:CAMPEP_0119015538 /NCGR_PEP_ID=MMETSP1176-20130426/11201_1 /TAXON_ID=265551 /ORGANISM="Synedropsis recta cf, Strain CCMP1620" /LENGTH=481 /DNA_ID=CAMNT_0006968843 /DNA_START=43 /DNA_END=1485 /DNA_ORIENTATION=+